MRTLLLVLLLVACAASPALAQTNVVKVWCADTCTVKVDEKAGRRVSERAWEFHDVRPGSRRVEATGTLGLRMHVGYAEIPATGTVELRISSKRMTVSPAATEPPKSAEAATVAASDATASGVEVQKAPKAASKQTRLAVVKLVARTGLEQQVVDLFTDSLVGELRKRPELRVVTSADIGAAIGQEREKQLTGCSEASCLSEIAGALGVDRLVHGSVGRVGNSLVVSLTMVDSKRALAVGSVSERLRSSSDEAFFDALPSLVSRLLASGP